MVNLENYEEYMLLEADGELTESEQKALHAFIERHPELKNELALFEAVKLTPDTSLVYEGKEELMKTAAAAKTRTIGLGGWKTYAAVAACAALALLLLLRPEQIDVIETPLATTTDIQKPTAVENNTNNFNVVANATTEQRLHSTPKDPVAIETKKTPVSTTTVRKQPSLNTEPAPVQVAVNEQPKPLPVATEEPKRKEIKTEPVKEQYVQVEDRVELPGNKAIHTENPNNRKLLAFAPVEEKFEGLADIKDAVNNKIERVKNIRGKIKDTDIQVRFGNTELFTVKL